MSTRAREEIELQHVERSVLLVRGHRVLLDETLASLYGVEVRALNRFIDYTATRRDRVSPEEAARRFVDAGTLHVWDDGGGVVAIAVLLHGSPDGRGVSFVFTPEGLRGRG